MPATGVREKFSVPDSRLIEVLEIVSENVGPNWTEVAQTLGLTTAEISTIKTRHTGNNPQEACWDMLCQWRQKTPRPTMVRDLQDALRRCRQVRVADLISKLMESPQNMDDILSPHGDREGKMLEAMYLIVDSACSHWRNIARHLKHTDRDIASIESKFGGRTREKLMHALYKWRYLVPLKEYKIANLVMALRSSGLAKTAEEVKELGNNTQLPFKKRKLKSDEIGIHIAIKHINVDSYIPKQQSKESPAPGDRSTDPTPRPRSILPNHLLKEYALNKIFFHLLDCLEQQEVTGAHPFVEWLFAQGGCCMTEVSRRGHFIAIRCTDGATLAHVRALVQEGEVSQVLSDMLVPPLMQRELGLAAVVLQATEY